jgi:hypothetical protein
VKKFREIKKDKKEEDKNEIARVLAVLLETHNR